MVSRRCGSSCELSRQIYTGISFHRHGTPASITLKYRERVQNFNFVRTLCLCMVSFSIGIECKRAFCPTYIAAKFCKCHNIMENLVFACDINQRIERWHLCRRWDTFVSMQYHETDNYMCIKFLDPCDGLRVNLINVHKAILTHASRKQKQNKKYIILNIHSYSLKPLHVHPYLRKWYS